MGKERYEELQLEVIELDNADVITESIPSDTNTGWSNNYR